MKFLMSTICILVMTTVAQAQEAKKCRFEGESASTSLEEHLVNIKQKLSGPELSSYFASCGSFLGGERYYADLISSEADVTLSEIREIKAFKDLSYKSLLASVENDVSVNTEMIDANTNWHNDDKVAATLVRLLLHSDRDVRLAAAGALKYTTSPVAIAKLIKMLKSESKTVRFEAVTALEGTKVPKARAALMELRNDPDPGIRATAILGTL